MRLSAAVITYNEEANIERFLNSLQDIADEIIVVDSHSTDSTRALASKFERVKFFENRFEGYGPQKNFAISKCSGDWILFLDADEILDEAAKKSIKQAVNSQTNVKVYQISFNNLFLNTNVRYGGWGKVYRERLFRKNAAQYDDALVHEKLIYDGQPEALEGSINHYTYRNIHHHIEKSNRYTSMMAEKMAKQGKKANFVKIFLSPCYQFINLYFFKLGILDGIVGFYAATTGAFYTFLKYMKLYEINSRK